MKIHFGQWLDGFIPHLPVREAVMSEAWVGPRGLVERLESAVGIDGPASAEPERVDAYAQRIERCVDGDVFFSRSWEIRKDVLPALHGSTIPTDSGRLTRDEWRSERALAPPPI